MRKCISEYSFASVIWIVFQFQLHQIYSLTFIKSFNKLFLSHLLFLKRTNITHIILGSHLSGINTIKQKGISLLVYHIINAIFLYSFSNILTLLGFCVCVCVSRFGGHMPDSNGESDAYLMTINWTKVPVLGTWWRLEYDKSNKNHRTASETE